MRKLPRATACAELVGFASLGGFWVANGLRVNLSYTPLHVGRDALMARYQLGEGVFAYATFVSAFFVVLPLILLQLLACVWGRTREWVTADRWAMRLLVITTLVGIPALLFLALVCSLSFGAGMVG